MPGGRLATDRAISVSVSSLPLNTQDADRDEYYRYKMVNGEFLAATLQGKKPDKDM
jgi:hypothetical protein